MFDDKDAIESMLLDCQCALFLINISDEQSFKLMEKLFEFIEFSEFTYLKKILVENKNGEKIAIKNEDIQNFKEKNEIEKYFQIIIKDGTGIEDLANQIKDYLNNPEKHIPNNFCSQIISEVVNEKENKFNYKGIINIIFIGNSNVGKTSLFVRLNKNFFKQKSNLSTIGVEKMSKSVRYKNDIIKVNFWDTAGQDRYRSLTKSFYKNADGIFLLFDLKEKDSFNDIAIWMKEIKDNCEHSDKDHIGPIIYLIGNKLDLMKRKVSKEEAEDKAGFYGIKYFEISCKFNLNIPEIYSRMIVECSKNLNNKEEQNSFQVKIENKKRKKKSKSLLLIAFGIK